MNNVEEVINEEENKKKFKKENITKLVEFNLGTQSTPSQHDFAHQMASGYTPSQQDKAHRNNSKSSSSNQPMNVDSDPIKNILKNSLKKLINQKDEQEDQEKTGLKKICQRLSRTPQEKVKKIKYFGILLDQP